MAVAHESAAAVFFSTFLKSRNTFAEDGIPGVLSVLLNGYFHLLLSNSLYPPPSLPYCFPHKD